jgi:hypothetical protein
VQRCWYVAALFILWLGVSGYQAAGASSFQSVSIAHELEIAPITSAELVGGLAQQAIAMSAAEMHTASAAFAREIVRKLPALWQMTVPEDVHPNSLSIEYELTAANGNPNRLSHAEQSDSEMRVRIVPLRPQIVSRRERRVVETTEPPTETEPDDSTPQKADDPGKTPNTRVRVERFNVVEGGIILYLYPRSIKTSGDYSGTLTIRLHQL